MGLTQDEEGSVREYRMSFKTTNLSLTRSLERLCMGLYCNSTHCTHGNGSQGSWQGCVNRLAK